MRVGICFDCEKKKVLTKHSDKGDHEPPFIGVCRKCHDKRHKMPDYKNKGRKYQPGTPRWKKKK